MAKASMKKHGSTRKKLLIVGAGEYAREFLWVAQDIPAAARDWDVAGLLDDASDAAPRLKKLGVKTPVLGRIADWKPKADEVFICAIGDPKVRLTLCAALESRGASFVNLIHPSAAVAPDATLGRGVFVYRSVVVAPGARVGNHVQLNIAASVGHDATLEDGCSINSHCDITGWVVLRRGVYLGSHASTIPNIEIGEFSTIGAGSVAFKSVPAQTTVVGVPGRKLPR